MIKVISCHRNPHGPIVLAYAVRAHRDLRTSELHLSSAHAPLAMEVQL